MEDQANTLLVKLIDSSPWIGGFVVLTIFLRKEILAFFFKIRPDDEIGKVLGGMSTKQDRIVELLEIVTANSYNNSTSRAVLTALVQQR